MDELKPDPIPPRARRFGLALLALVLLPLAAMGAWAIVEAFAAGRSRDVRLASFALGSGLVVAAVATWVRIGRTWRDPGHRGRTEMLVVSLAIAAASLAYLVSRFAI